MTENLDVNLNDLRSLAEQAALRAGALLRQKWDQPRQVRSKGYRDLVTDADMASQALITDMIRARFPDHGFITEEDDPDLPTSGRILWIVDPVDGTSNYSRQMPTYCVSIGAAVMVEGDLEPATTAIRSDLKVLAGVVYDPMRDELFSAALEQGSTLNGHALNVSPTAKLEKAVIGLDWSRQVKKRQAMLDYIDRFAHHVHTIRATGSAALALAWVAAGRIDLYFNLNLGPWDVTAANVLIKEAGGRVSNLHGHPWNLVDAGCTASNGLIHDSFLKMIGAGAKLS